MYLNVNIFSGSQTGTRRSATTWWRSATSTAACTTSTWTKPRPRATCTSSAPTSAPPSPRSMLCTAAGSQVSQYTGHSLRSNTSPTILSQFIFSKFIISLRMCTTHYTYWTVTLPVNLPFHWRNITANIALCSLNISNINSYISFMENGNNIHSIQGDHVKLSCYSYSTHQFLIGIMSNFKCPHFYNFIFSDLFHNLFHFPSLCKTLCQLLVVFLY